MRTGRCRARLRAGALLAAGAGGAAQELLQGEWQFGELWVALVLVGATGFAAHWKVKGGLLLFGAAHAAAALAFVVLGQ